MAMRASSTSTLGDFDILGRLGAGSFGEVYKVRRKVDSQVYVLKQINIDGMTVEEQKEAIKEVMIMASLDHPNCVRYYDSFLDTGKLNIVMEFCDSGDLQQFLKRHLKEGLTVNENRVWSIFLQIAIGLHYMHSNRILHRDMKAANVFMTRDQKVKIGDLGVAKVLGTNTNFAKTCVGTPYYLSPELCEDKPYNQKSDVWALGVILYQCCTLKQPFDARNQGALILKIIQGHYPPVSPAYSAELRGLVDRLLCRDSRRRPFVADLLSAPVCAAKAAELGLEFPPDILEKVAAREAREKSRVPKHTLTIEKDVTGSSRPQTKTRIRKPPTARTSTASSKMSGNIRGTRIRRGAQGSAAVRTPKTVTTLSLEAQKASITSRRSTSRLSPATPSTPGDGRPSTSGSRAPPPSALRFSPSGNLIGPESRAAASEVAALPDLPSESPVRRSPSKDRVRPSAAHLAELTSTLKVSSDAKPLAVPAASRPTPVRPLSHEEAEDIDAMMQAHFEQGVGISGKTSGTSNSVPDPSMKSTASAPAPASAASAASDQKKKKRVVHVQKTGGGVPEGFWDPVPKSGEGTGSPAERVVSDVSIQAVEVSDADNSHVGGSDRLGFGAVHAEFVRVSEDAGAEPVEEDVEDYGDEDIGDDEDFTDSEDEAADGGGAGGYSSIDEDIPEGAFSDAYGSSFQLSLEELRAEERRLQEQIRHQQEECEAKLPEELFHRVCSLLTDDIDIDLSKIASGASASETADTLTKKLAGIEVHEYIAVYKLALYATKLRENRKEILRRETLSK